MPICLWKRNRETASGSSRHFAELGFELTEQQAHEVRRGKDFIQLKNGPFDLDLVFAPDGIEKFADAWERRR